MGAQEPYDPAVKRALKSLGRRDEVAEDGAQFHALQLVGVADEDEPRVGLHGVDQPGQQRQRDHRRFVDHDDVRGQGVRRIVQEALALPALGAEQPMDGGRPQRRQLCANRLGDAGHDIRFGEGFRDGLGQPGRGLARRRCQRDAHRGVLLCQHGQQPGDRVCLAGAGPADDERQAVSEYDLGRLPLPVVLTTVHGR